MLHELPPERRLRDEAGSTVALNGTEYIEHLDAQGINWDALPSIQAVHQHRLWRRVGDSDDRESMNTAISDLINADDGFSMEGASWTNNLSWVKGYDNVLEPMQRLSARFHQIFDQRVTDQPSLTQTSAYRDALMYVLLLETSCFRYWGQGTWTEYAKTIFKKGEEVLRNLEMSAQKI